jgi:hypothetical protein
MCCLSSLLPALGCPHNDLRYISEDACILFSLQASRYCGISCNTSFCVNTGMQSYAAKTLAKCLLSVADWYNVNQAECQDEAVDSRSHWFDSLGLRKVVGIDNTIYRWVLLFVSILS